MNFTAQAKPAKKAAGAKKGGGKGSGYTREITLSPELAAVVGAKQMARYEVVKKVWSIIKEKNLYVSRLLRILFYNDDTIKFLFDFLSDAQIFFQDPKNKQYAICDDDLMKVIGVKRFRTFGMMKYLKNHFVD